jgi:general secretion pathway protein A
MYERFYNLRERPFSLTPDPDYLYPSRVHREALSYLRYGIEGHAGFVVITGEIGSGKTTLLQTVLRGLDRQTSVSRLVNTMLDARELVEAVMLDFGLEPSNGQSKPMLLRDLAQFLVDQRVAGRLALLVIDEAQNLSPAALEEVRMLSNLETEKSKLIQIVLIGQPSLRDMLARPDLEQLRQRITISYHLEPLDGDETDAYINHRLRRAAIGAPLQLGHDVTSIVHDAAHGVPRKINVIADALLLFGYGEDRHIIDPELARQVLQELEATGVIVPASGPAPVPARIPAMEVDWPDRAGDAPVGVAPPAIAVPPAIAAMAEQLAVREQEVRAREVQVATREHQLLEQRRVLAEGFDLLHNRRDATELPQGAAERPAWPPTRPASAMDAMQTPAPLTRSVISAMPTDSMWSRIRRSLFGSAKPVFED